MPNYLAAVDGRAYRLRRWAPAALSPALAVAALFVVRHPYEGIVGDGMIYIGRALANLDPGGVGRDLMFQNDGQSNFTLYPAIATFLLKFMSPLAAGALLAAIAMTLWLGGIWALVRASGEKRVWAALGVVVTAATGYAFLNPAEATPVPRPVSEALVLFALAAILTSRLRLAFVLLMLAAAFHPIMALPGIAVFYLVLCHRDRRWVWFGVACAAAIGVAAALGLPLFDRLTQRMDAEWLDVVRQRNSYLFPHEWTQSTWTRQAIQAITILVAARRLADPFRTVALSALAAGAAGIAIAWFCGLYLPLLLVIQAQTWRMYWLTAVMAAVAMARLATSANDTRERLLVVALALAWLSADSSFALVLTLAALAFGATLSKVYRAPDNWDIGALAILGVFVLTLSFLSAVSAYQIYFVDGALRATPAEIWAVVFRDTAFVAAIAVAMYWSRAPSRLRDALAIAAFPAAACAALLWYGPPPAQREMFADGRSAELAKLMPDARGEVLWLKGRAEPWAFLGRPNWGSEIQGASIIFSRPLAMIYKDRANRQVRLGLAEQSLVSRVTSPPTTAYAAPSADSLRTLCSQPDAPTYVVWPPDAAKPIDPDLHAKIWTPRHAHYDLILGAASGSKVEGVTEYAVADCASRP
ncbi:MAG TPA: hypothetical protein PKA55_18335 [Rhodoblastus sp.]|nr:hypothetical protein [Rhodoblastus sp.]